MFRLPESVYRPALVAVCLLLGASASASAQRLNADEATRFVEEAEATLLRLGVEAERAN